MTKQTETRFYILGDPDAEMAVIETLLMTYGCPFRRSRDVRPQYVDPYGPYPVVPLDASIELANGQTFYDGDYVTVVFVECRPSSDWPPSVVTFAPQLGDVPALLEIVDDLVSRYDEKPSPQFMRWIEVVAAHDHHGIEGALAVGATTEELARLAALDDLARGVTSASRDLGHRIHNMSPQPLTCFLVQDLCCASVVARTHDVGEDILLVSPQGALLVGDDGPALAFDGLEEQEEDYDAPAGVSSYRVTGAFPELASGESFRIVDLPNVAAS